MSKNFKRFLRRGRAFAIVKALLVALTAGSAVAGVLLYLITHGIWSIPDYCAPIAGGAAFLVSGVIAFLLLRVSVRKVAAVLDESFGLEERVQTALQNEDSEGAIYDLLREDTEARLSEIPTRRLKPRRLWIYLVSLVVGIGLLVAAVLLIPTPEPPPPIPDTPFSITKLQVIAMEELIESVKTSEMESPYRENVADSLETLLGNLKQATTMAERDEALAVSVNYIYGQTDDSSSAVEIIDALALAADTYSKALASAINYYNWARGKEWDSFAMGMTAHRATFVHPDAAAESPDLSRMLSDTKSSLAAASAGIEQALVRSGTDTSDILYISLLRFARSSGEDGARGLDAIGTAGTGYDEIQVMLDESYSTFNIELFRALDVLRINTSVGEHAMTRLSEIFGYRLPKFERPQIVGESGSDAPGDNTEGGGGGAIGEGTVYGSDELVLDPFTGEYVEYGTIISRYHTIVLQKLQGDFYTDEEKQAIEKYFEILYGGFDE